MNTNHKPATTLPFSVIGKNGYTIWAGNEIIFTANAPRARGTNAHKDAAYIAHACNAYPELVEALRMAHEAMGNCSEQSNWCAREVAAPMEVCRALLAKLEEAA